MLPCELLEVVGQGYSVTLEELEAVHVRNRGLLGSSLNMYGQLFLLLWYRVAGKRTEG